jgi:hypothetical protein
MQKPHPGGVVGRRSRSPVTFGIDLSHAAQGARERLSRLHPGAVLRQSRLMGRVL